MIVKIIEVTKEVKVKLEKDILIVEGRLGITSEKYVLGAVKIQIEEFKIELMLEKINRKNKALIGTLEKLIKNQITGVLKGYTLKLIIRSHHFPMKVEVDNDKIKIFNFNGQKNYIIIPKSEEISAKVLDGKLVLFGLQKGKLGELYGQIKYKTRFKGFDKRIFQDGLYLVERE